MGLSLQLVLPVFSDLGAPSPSLAFEALEFVLDPARGFGLGVARGFELVTSSTSSGGFFASSFLTQMICVNGIKLFFCVTDAAANYVTAFAASMLETLS